MTATIGDYFKKFTITWRDLGAMLGVFVVYFLSAKASLYVYYTFQTSPALIWPPVGIALLAVIFGGYRMWLPIFLAQSAAVIQRSPGAWQIALIIAVAYALQAVVALYILRKFKFDSSLSKLRDMVLLVSVAFVVTLIEPIIATVAQMTLYSLSVSPAVNLGRAWGAGIFSVLVIAPFVLTWYRRKGEPLRTMMQAENIELGAALVALFALNHFLFWTSYPQYFGISVIFFLPLILIWFSLRFQPRWVTLALLLTAIHGIAGTILAHPTAIPVNAQLLVDEIYIGLVAPIFLLLVAAARERRDAHKRLEEAYRVAAAADKAKSEFIAILAHELRNPLAPLVTSLELLKFEPQTENALRTIEKAEKHAEMIRRLLDDLLDTARLTQNKFKLQKEMVSLRDIIEQSVAAVKGYADERKHELRVTLPEEDMRFVADPIRIKQIVINLLNNACKYTKPGGRITLRCVRRGNELVLAVTDNGIGIAPHMLESIFEPFEQLDAQSSAGLGIGLFLTKRLVEMHDGTIVAESAGEGAGSTFTVHLPLSTVAEMTPTTKTREDNSSATRRILIVDDNEAAADVMKTLLEHHGHSAHVAYSGKNALEVVNSVRPDIIFLDIGMPHMDGHEAARQIRNGGWGGKLVALTGYGQMEDRARANEAGFDHHLVKPVGIKDIVALLSA